MQDNVNAFGNFIQEARRLGPLPMAIAHPCSPDALLAAVKIRQESIAEPILIGPIQRIQHLATEANIDLSGIRLVDSPHSHASAAQAVELVRQGQANSLMKGSLHTDELISAVLVRDTGLRTERRLSHIYVMKVDSYPRYLFITDAAINITPDLAIKRDICQNAIDLCHALGIAQPKVAILSAVETVTPAIPSTLDAAALCKMADRGQITGAILDGPLAFDNAISLLAAETKGISSPVAGRPDILLTPDLEAGNILAKQLTWLAHASAAGIVMGARVPIVLTSRADPIDDRLASAAIANLLAHHRLHGDTP